jgi:hypothetical protein
LINTRLLTDFYGFFDATPAMWVNNNTEDWFLRRIQHNILIAAEKYLK